jgi:hypothetical protein
MAGQEENQLPWLAEALDNWRGFLGIDLGEEEGPLAADDQLAPAGEENAQPAHEDHQVAPLDTPEIQEDQLGAINWQVLSPWGWSPESRDHEANPGPCNAQETYRQAETMNKADPGPSNAHGTERQAETMKELEAGGPEGRDHETDPGPSNAHGTEWRDEDWEKECEFLQQCLQCWSPEGRDHEADTRPSTVQETMQELEAGGPEGRDHEADPGPSSAHGTEWTDEDWKKECEFLQQCLQCWSPEGRDHEADPGPSTVQETMQELKAEGPEGRDHEADPGPSNAHETEFLQQCQQCWSPQRQDPKAHTGVNATDPVQPESSTIKISGKLFFYLL